MSEQLPAGTRTLPELLKQKGFHTAVIGKFFHITEYAETQMMAFDRIEHARPPPGWRGEPAMGANRPAPRSGDKGAVLKDRVSKEAREKQRQQSDRYGDSGRKPEDEGDYQISQTAVTLLGKFGLASEKWTTIQAALLSFLVGWFSKATGER